MGATVGVPSPARSERRYRMKSHTPMANATITIAATM